MKWQHRKLATFLDCKYVQTTVERVPGFSSPAQMNGVILRPDRKRGVIQRYVATALVHCLLQAKERQLWLGQLQSTATHSWLCADR